jgi:hypothetical protein
MEEWERRLRWLAGCDKTPEIISRDLIGCLLELDKLRNSIKTKEETIFILSQLESKFW